MLGLNYWLLAWVGWLGLLTARAVPGAAQSGFLVDVLSADDGVPRNTVTGFAQGDDGFLWMISDQALAKFDGVRFVVVEAERYAPAPFEEQGAFRSPGRLFTSESGTIWLWSSSRELWRLHGPGFERWPELETRGGAVAGVAELAGDRLLAWTDFGQVFLVGRTNAEPVSGLGGRGRPVPGSGIWDRSGRLCLLNGAGEVVGIDDRGAVVPLAKESELGGRVLALCSDPIEGLWMGTEKGLYRRRGTGEQPVEPPLPGGGSVIRRLASCPDGSIWASLEGKAWLWRNGTWKGPLGDWPSNGRPYPQLVDKSGQLWLAPPGRGVWCIRPGGGEQERLGVGAGITSDVTSLFCDRDGTIWAGLYRLGVARIRPRRFQVVTVSPGTNTLSAPIWNIAEDAAGAIWVCAEGTGLARLNGSVCDEFSLPSGRRTPIPWTKAIAADRSGRVWGAFVEAGLFRGGDTGLVMEVAWPQGAGFPRTLYQDRAGRWWMGSDSGLDCWTGTAWEQVGAAKGLPRAPVRAVVEDGDGRLWAGTEGRGAGWWDGTRFTMLKRPEELPGDSVFAFCGGSGDVLWIGTDRGLCRRQRGRMSVYSASQGLPDGRVLQILEDELGFLWLGTGSGLCRVALRSFEAVDKGERTQLDCMMFDHNDGVPTRVLQDRSSPACLRARDGRLWFLTAGGAIVCDPRTTTPSVVTPRPSIQEVLVDHVPQVAPALDGIDRSEQAQALSEFVSRVPKRIALDPGSHLVEIRYTAPGLDAPGKIRFEHRMEGLETGWTRAGSRRFAVYVFPKPGTYRFQVRASNSDGRWNAREAELTLTVRPAYWQRWWFPVVAMVALSSGGVAAVVQWRRQRVQRSRSALDVQRARQAERVRISRDLHDNLGASLTEIGMLAEDTPEGLDAQGAPSENVRAIREKVQTMVHELDAMVWAVDPRHDTVGSLCSYLAGFVEEFTHTAGLSCSIETPEVSGVETISSDTRHSVFLAVREAVHNAVRHGAPGRIQLRIERPDGEMRITIRDDGRGFDPATAASGNGLGNLRARMGQLGGACDVRSKPGEGAMVQLRFPIQSKNRISS